ncbi:MAG TPA: hypothetical protein VNO21_04430 [Polyangiaceae bacterium]|nr:hypothetical protein [Polyangiaceae bacterium]
MNTGWLAAASAVALVALSCAGRTDSREESQTGTQEITVSEDIFRPHCADRTQFGGDATHENATCVIGQRLENRISSAIYDPFVAQEVADSTFGGLLIHYPMPLTRGDQLFMLRKAGTFIPCDPPGSGQPAPCGLDNNDHIQWTQVAYHNRNGHLSERWSFVSDFKPFRAAGSHAFEQVFQAALAHRVVFVPGAGGTVHVVDERSGREIERLNPFGADVDGSYHIASPLTVDDEDNLYYNVVQTDATLHPTRALLVHLGAHGFHRMADYTALTAGAPLPTDMCRGVYHSPQNPLPWPELDANGAVVPPTPVACGIQAPPADMAPALTADRRTLYVATRALGDRNYSYLIAVRTSDLSLQWNRSLRGLVHDGCGVLNGYESDPNDPNPCRNGAPKGIDLETGTDPAGEVADGDTASPVVLPDDTILLPAYTKYNYGRGHLFKFTHQGEFLSSYDFGWDVTPAVWRHDGTYSIIDKDNHYFENIATTGPGPYDITRLDATLKPQWHARSTETKSCKRDADGNISCVQNPENVNGFEWCVNMPAIDVLGNVFVTSEDGNAYHISRGGKLTERVFLDEALGSAYTPSSLDRHGHTIALNAGVLTVIGSD